MITAHRNLPCAVVVVVAVLVVVDVVVAAVVVVDLVFIDVFPITSRLLLAVDLSGSCL